MLTPKEFVVNVRDARKNLSLLEHINSGGEPTEFIAPTPDLPILPRSTDTQSLTPLPVTSLDVTQKNLQLSPSLADSIVNDSLLPTAEDDRVIARAASINYDAPPMIFRKQKSTNSSPATVAKGTPTQWNSVEDLLGGNNELSTIFNLENDAETDRFDSPATMLQQQVMRLSEPSSDNSLTIGRFTSEERSTAKDLATNASPFTETIAAPSSSEDKKDDSSEMELLAVEIYHRLQQRLEVERERQGRYHGRLPW